MVHFPLAFQAWRCQLSVQANTQKSLEDKLHNTFTYYRVPLMAAAFLIFAAYLRDLYAFFIGVPVVIFGELIQIWATSHLHKDEKLTISGPYSHTRNPMYTGRFFVGLGFFIMSWNIYLIIGYILLFAIYAHLRVAREEKRLKVIFEPDYQNYCREINRWLPKIKPYSNSEPRKASWAQVCANHEQIVALGIIIVLVLVYVRIEYIAWHWPK